MSSYIIAGSADSIDTAYCEEIARRIQAKYTNIDFRIVIKHPSQWEEYLQEICRIYGFLRKSNPIIYTFDGKIIGDCENFKETTKKYFGLDEELMIVENISNRVNMKLAEEDIKAKKIVKTNFKTLNEKIDFKYKELLAKKILKCQLKEKKEYLVNGIEYIHREIENMVERIKFTVNQQIPVITEEIVPEDINLVSLSLNDQIKPEETIIKQAFVTNEKQKQKIASSEHDRMSEVSRTNKMHDSIISYDKDSKGVKESNKTKLKIDEENDDVPDYIDYPMSDTIVCELFDQFFIAFDSKSLVGEELIFYHNEDQNGNYLRIYNDGRPIKGHRVLLKEVHFENENQPQNEELNKMENNELAESNEMTENKIGEKEDQEEGEEKEMKEQKSKTQPNIPVMNSNKNLAASAVKNAEDEGLSEHHSDLNLLSHLNYHTLFIHKPLSPLELKNLMYFIHQTNTIGCLQFLPENPNPKLKLFVRKFLIKNESSDLLPVEQFIEKQLEDLQFTEFTVPSDKGVIPPLLEELQTYKITIINNIGFNHFLYKLNQDESQDKLGKVIKYLIDHMLSIEEEVTKDIGYNLIFTKKYLLIVPIVEPYEIYQNNKLFFDGLAYLGYVQTAKLVKPYEIKHPKVGTESKGEELRKLLAICSGKFKED